MPRAPSSSWPPISKLGSATRARPQIVRFRTVTDLYSRGCPSNITRHVVAVVVDAVKCLVVWANAHVSQECGEVVPSLIDSDSASAISVEARRGWLVAARHHIGPRPVRGCTPHAVSHWTTIQQNRAAATFTTAQVGTRAREANTAIAKCFIDRFAPICSETCLYREQTKATADHWNARRSHTRSITRTMPTWQ